jgi:hypothetical protein
MTTTEPRTFTLKTRSTHPFALVGFTKGEPTGPHGIRPITGIRLVGYAASNGPAVVKRAQRLQANIVAIVDGKVSVTVR